MPPCIFEKRKVQGLLQRRRALRFCADLGAPQWPGNPKKQQSPQQQRQPKAKSRTTDIENMQRGWTFCFLRTLGGQQKELL